MNNTPKCPYCGDKMELMIVSPECINGTCTAWYQCVVCESSSPTSECPANSPRKEIIKKALALALRRAEPKNRVLTLEEIIKAGVVWLEGKPLPIMVPAIVYGEASDDANRYKTCIAFTERCGEINDYPVYDYGRRWRSWLRKPTKEEMEATPWEK